MVGSPMEEKLLMAENLKEKLKRLKERLKETSPILAQWWTCVEKRGKIWEAYSRTGNWLLLVLFIALKNTQGYASFLQNFVDISMIVLNNSTKLIVNNKRSWE